MYNVQIVKVEVAAENLDAYAEGKADRVSNPKAFLRKQWRTDDRQQAYLLGLWGAIENCEGKRFVKA